MRRLPVLAACLLAWYVYTQIGTSVDPLTLALWRARRTQLARLHAYALAGKFPKNEDFPDRREAYFIDRHGNACAVASLMIQSGREAEARAIARADNHVRVMAVTTGPMIDWIQDSGLLREECALIQPTYEWRQYEGYPRTVIAALAAAKGAGLPGGDTVAERERTRIREHLLAVEARLRENTAAALRVAAWRHGNGCVALTIDPGGQGPQATSVSLRIGFDVRGKPARAGGLVPVTVTPSCYPAPRDGAIEVVARDASGAVRARRMVRNVTARPAEPPFVRVALECPVGTERVEASFLPADGTEPARRVEPFRAAPGGTRVAVILGSTRWSFGEPGHRSRWPLDRTGGGWSMCYASPEMLPEDARAYAGVEAIVIERSRRIKELSDAQWRALVDAVHAGGTLLVERAADFEHPDREDPARLMTLMPGWASRDSIDLDRALLMPFATDPKLLAARRQHLFPARAGARAIAPPELKARPLAYELPVGAGRVVLSSVHLEQGEPTPIEPLLELLLHPPAAWRHPPDGASGSSAVRAAMLSQLHAENKLGPDPLPWVYRQLDPADQRALAEKLRTCDAAPGLAVAEIDRALKDPMSSGLPPVPLERLALHERELDLPARAGPGTRRARLDADRSDPASWRAELAATPALAPDAAQDPHLELLSLGDEVPREVAWRSEGPYLGAKLVEPGTDVMALHDHACVNSVRLAAALNAACAGARVGVSAGGREQQAASLAALLRALDGSGHDVALIDGRTFVTPLRFSHRDDRGNADPVVVPVNVATDITSPDGRPLIVPAFRSELGIALFRRSNAWPEALVRWDAEHPAQFRPAIERCGRWPRLRVVGVRPLADAIAFVELAQRLMRTARFLERRYGFDARELARILGDASTRLDGRATVFPCVRDPRFDFYLEAESPTCDDGKPLLERLLANVPETGSHELLQSSLGDLGEQLDALRGVRR